MFETVPSALQSAGALRSLAPTACQLGRIVWGGRWCGRTIGCCFRCGLAVASVWEEAGERGLGIGLDGGIGVVAPLRAGGCGLFTPRSVLTGGVFVPCASLVDGLVAGYDGAGDDVVAAVLCTL